MPQANPTGGANSERLENVTFPQARIDINDNFEALQTLNSGNSEPSTKAAFMQWLDTSSDPAILKVRNSTNQSWVEVGSLSASQYTSKGLTEIANGGTGQTTAAAAIAALLPGQSGNSGKSLTTNGSALSWAQTISSAFSRFDYTGSNQTWIKPTTGTICVILCWGGGGSGASNGTSSKGGGGGGGGACGLVIKPLSELTDSSYTVYVAAGGSSVNGSNGNNGGNSTVSGSGQGTIVTGWGGQGGTMGDQWAFGYGGHGGGNTRNGSSHINAINNPQYSVDEDWGNGRLGALIDGAGAGAFFSYSTSAMVNSLPGNALATNSVFGGGGGGKGQANLVPSHKNSWNYGGASVFGGGGGGGSNEDGQNYSNASGGTSQLGGNGGRGGGSSGGTVASGSVPAGGGGGNEGSSGSGGHGRVEIYVF